MVSLSIHTLWIAFRATLANNVLYSANVAIVQLSILFFYIRMFGVKKAMRIACYVFIVAISTYAIVNVLSRIFMCGSEVEKAAFVMDPDLPGKCLDDDKLCSATSIVHVIFDVSVLILPIPLIWTLHMSIFQKVVVTAVLAAGSLYVIRFP